MSKTNNPSNPTNSGTLPATQLYTQDEVDALLANMYTQAQVDALIDDAKSKCDLLWTNPAPTSAFDGQTLTMDGWQDYNLFAIGVRLSKSSSSIRSLSWIARDAGETNIVFNSSDGDFGRKITISGSSIIFADATMKGYMVPQYIYGIKL
jgi:hypothetical protein